MNANRPLLEASTLVPLTEPAQLRAEEDGARVAVQRLKTSALIIPAVAGPAP